MAEVATTKLYENDKVIVWEMILQPGESSGVHTHSHSYVFSVLEGSTCEVLDKDGNSCGSLSMEPGFTLHFQLEGKELISPDFRIPITHSARNLGKTRFREILVETK